MNTNVLDKFKSYYSLLNLSDQNLIDEIYDSQIQFKDPVQQIDGLDALKSYFERLNANLVQGTTTFGREIIKGNQVSIEWEMDLMLKRPKKSFQACGVSILEIDKKVVSQRDYFDAGEFFYEHVPLLGNVVRLLKRRLK